MKNQIAMCIMLSLAAVMIMPAIAQAAGSSSTIDALSIYSLQVNPNPIFAGQNITINLQLYDSYPSSLNNVNLELEGSYPILNVSPSNPYLIGSIGQGLYGGLNSYFTYNIHIPKNTPSGNYTLNLVANYQTIQMASGIAVTVTGSSVMPLTFYVHGTPQLSISPTVTSIVPGSSSTVSTVV